MRCRSGEVDGLNRCVKNSESPAPSSCLGTTSGGARQLAHVATCTFRNGRPFGLGTRCSPIAFVQGVITWDLCPRSTCSASPSAASSTSSSARTVDERAQPVRGPELTRTTANRNKRSLPSASRWEALWRWRRDLNPRYGVTVHSISSAAPSAARTRHAENCTGVSVQQEIGWSALLSGEFVLTVEAASLTFRPRP